MSEQKESNIRIFIDGRFRQVIVPHETALAMDVVIQALDFKTRNEWCQTLLERFFKLDPNKKQPMKNIVISEVENITATLKDVNGNRRECRRKTIERYLRAGFERLDVAKLVNSTVVYTVASEMSRADAEALTVKPVEPVAVDPKGELEESLTILNLAKSMYEATNQRIAWEALSPVKRIMWIDQAVTDLSTKLISFAEVLMELKKYPNKTLASRKEWANRSKFILKNGDELQITSPEVASVWKPTGEDLLADDWFLL